MKLVAIVGRPNVGKSTLFNRIVGAKKAIVLDTPGVTRDRHYGVAKWGGPPFDVVDTGGFELGAESTEISAQMRDQALAAIEEADLVLFVVDGRAGVTPDDEAIADILRRSDKPTLCAVNKIDGARHAALAYEFYQLGLGEEIWPLSAEHGYGVGEVLDEIEERLDLEEPVEEDEESARETRVAIIGRPNVGKSTLVNRLLGEERMIVNPIAGTTRDSIDAPLERNGQRYLLIDTAGLRRKKKINRRSSEGFSVMRTLRSVERCHVAVVLLDAEEGLTEQDMRIIGIAAEKGRGLLILINKWDALEKDHKTMQHFTLALREKLPFVSYAPFLFVSALTGQRVHKLLNEIDSVRAAHLTRIETGPLNRWLEETLQRHHPPHHRGKRPRIYYVSQVRTAPPTFIFHCNHPDAIHFSYQRFLENRLREYFQLSGSPARFKFRGKENPFQPEES